MVTRRAAPTAPAALDPAPAPVHARPLCSGFWGKLPGHGDFVGRGLPHDWVQAWDDWLQRGLALAFDAHGKAGLQAELAQMPVWYFVACPPAGTDARQSARPLCWCGLIAPSRDRVGRPFPLTLVQAWPAADVVNFGTADQRIDCLRSLLPQAETPGDADDLADALEALTGLPDLAARSDPGGPAADMADAASLGRSWWWRSGTHEPAMQALTQPQPQIQPWPPADGWLVQLLAGR